MTLQSVHPDVVTKIGTKGSSRQDGGDVDDMDVSHDCDLNLYTNFEPTSFEEDTSHDEWKEAMPKEYDALIKNGMWKLVDPPFEPNQLDTSGSLRTSTNQITHLKSTKQCSWQKDLHRNKVLIMKRIFTPYQNGIPSILYFPW
jgi:hypothetical protein